MDDHTHTIRPMACFLDRDVQMFALSGHLAADPKAPPVHLRRPTSWERGGRRSMRRPFTVVDVVATGGWAGGDTTDFGRTLTHTQISSRNPDYQGAAALEMVFHEASHELVSPRNGPIAQLLVSAERETGVAVHRSLWHGILFVTVGEVVRETLARAGEGPYEPVANGVFRATGRSCGSR
jgi:hypothetical protein